MTEEDFGSEWKWVIPHYSSLDYCHVLVGLPTPDGRVRVEGRQDHGWQPSGAFIRTKIAADKLTDIPSWHTDFLALYDDPCHPKAKDPK